MKSLLRGVAQLVCGHPWKIVLVACLAVGVCGWKAATELGIRNDTNDLISEHLEVQGYFLDYLKEFNTRDPIVVVIEGESFEKNAAAVEALAEKIRQRPKEIVEIYYKNDLSGLKPHFLLFQSDEELKKILNQIRNQAQMLVPKATVTQTTTSHSPGINLNDLLDEANRHFEEVEKQKGRGSSLDDLGDFADRMIKDLEGLATSLGKPATTKVTVEGEIPTEVKKVEKPDGQAEFEEQLRLNTYIQFLEGEILLMMLTPGEPDPDSMAPFAETVRNLRADLAEVSSAHPEVKMGLTGEVVLLDDELRQSNIDMAKAAPIALVLIAILFFSIYREIFRPGLALIALLFALGWSMGFTVFTVGHLNILSQAFVLMLLGLGVDFGIQILGRYEEERAAGRSLEDAIGETLEHTGIAVLTGGLTTAIAFYTMCFNEFKGLMELGVIAGSGILFCLLANLVLLPSFLAIGDRLLKSEFHKKDDDYGETGSWWDRVLYSNPAVLLVLFLLITGGAVFFGKQVRFDYNLLNLQNPGIEAVQLARKLMEVPGMSFLFGVIIAEDLEDAKRKTDLLEALPTVASVTSPANILPAGQDSKLAILKQVRKELANLKPGLIETSIEGEDGDSKNKKPPVDVERAKASLQDLLAASREGFAQAKKYRNSTDKRAKKAFVIFERLIPALEKCLQNLDKLTATSDQPDDASAAEAVARLNAFQQELFEKIKAEFEFLESFDMENRVTLKDLPPESLRRYISPNGKVLLEAHPKEDIWEREPNKRFVADLRTVSPRATGSPVQNYVFIDTLRGAYVEAGIYAFIAIVIMVALHFRKVLPVILSVLPLIVGMAWTLGIMGLFNIPFNPANIITLPLVIGIGVAFGIYVVDRHEEASEIQLFSCSTGKAIFLSAATTLIGFGCMMMGEYRGLASLGQLMSIGILMTFLASVLVLPQVIALIKGPAKTKSAAE